MGDYSPIVSPPSSHVVAGEKRVVLYDHSGAPMVRQIGFTAPKRCEQQPGDFAGRGVAREQQPDGHEP